MNTNGKLFDVIVEEETYFDEKKQLDTFLNLKVWADKGMREDLLKIEGITNVYNTMGVTEYTVYIDPSYDKEFLKEEIKAVILCREDEGEKNE
jgi:hypothetical protein